MTRSKRNTALIVSLALLISFAAGLYAGKGAVGSTVPEPGSAEDPLVSLSYMQTYVKEQLAAVSNIAFEVVTINPGQILQCGAGTEVIVRAGNAEAVGNKLGDGIPNVSSGKDLKNGEKVPLQHLLIIPRDDGRGVKGLPTGTSGQEKIFLMVRGQYTIK